ncbi:DUF6745 domain-containing protein [Okeania sp. SIO1F9]|uniref:DUF6745 domain-containing protein n=1 Tax=Okeania sp. SIO1F9 TaxID=2607813 RepID=UPI00257F459B|nr:hypothetical protein [Okeania sp. SIO1F9]
MKKLITKLTPDQETLIPVYRKKWHTIAHSTQPINRQKATKAIQLAYNLMGDPNPEIVFCESPYAAFDTLLSVIWQRWESKDDYGHRHIFGDRWQLLREQLKLQITDKLCEEIDSKIREDTNSSLTEESLKPEDLWSHILYSQIEEKWQEIVSDISIKLLCLWSYPIPTELWSSYVAWIDFCISVINCDYNSDDWQVLESIVRNCGWIYPLRHLCIICDRPRKLFLDDEYRPHAEGTPAIEFADGYSLYANHGVRLPEEYGIFSPQKWEAKWLLSTKNAELRRVLIQEIGYEKICQDLQTLEIDTWQEYTLLRIDDDADIEPILILKMICPSTGNIHTLRVPPDINSAKEAISWVNWGIYPEEFYIQT